LAASPSTGLLLAYGASNIYLKSGKNNFDLRLRVGHGPAFKQSQVVEPFESVDVYNVTAEILGPKPASNDGGHAAAKAVLRSQQ